jgi:hypothetical protein
MTPDFADTFALQRLYEKWVIKEEWSLDKEAIPLLLGREPGVDCLNDDCRQLQSRIKEAIANGSLNVTENESDGEKEHRVKPETVYRWAMANRIELPKELVNLMEFIMKTLLAQQSQDSSENPIATTPSGNDSQQILGACFAIVATFPDECRNSRGMIKPERILQLLDKHADKLFNGKLPALSSTVIRDLVNHWLLKLK